MKKASEFIDSLMNSFKLEEHSTSLDLFSTWESMAGADIGAHSTLKEIDGNTLVVEVDHPGWIQIISLRKKEILNKLDTHFAALYIKDISVEREM